MKNILVLLALVSASAHASYEKTIMWGGRSAGVAGIATPYVQGSTAVYFNPAGLAADKTGHDFGLNISAVSSQYKAPVITDNTQESSVRQTTTPGALTYSYSPNDKMGFGIGYYVAGGSRAKYSDITKASRNGTFKLESEMTIMELALGMGYKISDALKVGIAYRVSMATASFSLIQRTSAVSDGNIELKDLKGNNYNGFKLGAQYKISDKTHLGVMYRSQTEFAAKGKIGGTNHTPVGTTNFTDSDVTAHTMLPQMAAVGVTHDFNDAWTGLAEYTWMQYSRIKTVDLDGMLNGTTALSPIQQQWTDRHTFKVAGEYKGMSWPIRMGLLYATRTTAKEWARASFNPPGPGYDVTLGTGKQWGNFGFDLGAEYTWGSGDSENPGNSDIRRGKYEVSAYGLHLGGSYSF